jgi:hypothetical protein
MLLAFLFLLASQDFDLGQYLLRQAVPTLALVAVVAGSALLWVRTRRGSGLAQLASSTILLLAAILDHVRNLAVPIESQLSSGFWSTLRDIESGAVILSIIGFSLGYVWYASQHKRI